MDDTSAAQRAHPSMALIHDPPPPQTRPQVRALLTLGADARLARDNLSLVPGVDRHGRRVSFVMFENTVRACVCVFVCAWL